MIRISCNFCGAGDKGKVADLTKRGWIKITIWNDIGLITMSACHLHTTQLADTITKMVSKEIVFGDDKLPHER